MTKFDKSDYQGTRNELVGWLDYELNQAFNHTVWDENYYLDLSSPAGVNFRIFVDCGDFDYFEWVRLPNGMVLDYGHPILRELEYHFDAQQQALLKKVAPW